MSRSKSIKVGDMPMVVLGATAIDIGSTIHMAAVNRDADEVLEEHGFHVILVDARYANNVMATTVDSYGFLHGSFRPNAEVATLRAYMRQRARMIEYSASHIQRGRGSVCEATTSS